jgi:hypothetical protein
MARINVRVTVTAPEEISIPSVRANYSSTANIFRVFFENFLSLSLSLFSTLLGYVLSLRLFTGVPSLQHQFRGQTTLLCNLRAPTKSVGQLIVCGSVK